MMTETKNERFIRVAESRTNKAIQMIRNISNLSNRSNYYFTDENVKKIFSALEKEIKIAKLKFTEEEKSEFKLK
jgi:hypothetical protein